MESYCIFYICSLSDVVKIVYNKCIYFLKCWALAFHVSVLVCTKNYLLHTYRG